VTLLLAAPRACAKPELANSIVAVVGDVVITYREVWNSIAPAIELLKARHMQNPQVLQQKVEELAKGRIKDLVDQQLILNDFTNAGYNLPETFIEDRVRERIRQDYYGDRAKLTKTLREKGISWEDYKKAIKDDVIIRFLRDKHIEKQLIISPHKIQAYYETNLVKYKMEDQVKLRMIVLNKPKDAPDFAPKMAQEILAKLEKGAPFAEMAAIYSEGSQRTVGGDWGWVDRNVLQKDLANVAFSLKPGQRSGVIDTPEAVFIMSVEEARLAHTKPLSEVRDEIEKYLLAQEQQRLLTKWVDHLESKAFVRYFTYQIVLE
jgi:peptidyl-prolyl cis-trans isomerase SurA